MEGTCHTLDLQLLHLTVDGPTTSISFEKCQAAVKEVNQLEVKLKHEKGKKIYLEQVLTALVLTTGINSQQPVINTGIPALLVGIANSISRIVSTWYINFKKYTHVYNNYYS